MLIEVTQRNISGGHRQDCEKCPVGLAFKDRLCPDYYVGVEPEVVVIYDSFTMESVQYIPLPDEVISRIRKFDLGRPMRPFAFEIEDSPYLLATGAQS